MTMCIKTLYRVFPEIKAFGCCHEVFGTQKLLCKVVEEELGIKDVKKDEIKVFEDNEALLANAPSKEMNMFKIPKVIN